MLVRRPIRRGTILVESAFVYPILFLLVLGLVILGWAVFRYQQVAHIAREASRWASVRGALYEREQNKLAATPQDVYDQVILPNAIGMLPEHLSYSVDWATDANGQPIKTPTSSISILDSATNLNKIVHRSNTVSVTVTYTWNTEFFGTMQLTSTSVNIISY